MRQVAFRHELIDDNDLVLGTVAVAEPSRVALDSTANIARTAKFVLHADVGKDIDFLRNYIRPILIIDEDGEHTETPLGVFLLSSPVERLTDTGRTYSIEAYDRTQILMEDRVTDRYFLPRGYQYSKAITSLVNSAGIRTVYIDPNDKMLRRDREWEIGTSKLDIINELLKEMNFEAIFSDEQGTLRCIAYRLPWQKVPEVHYKTDELSKIYPSGAERSIDFFNVPNVWVCVASNAEDTPLVAKVENKNPASLTSIIQRRRRIVRYESISDIADQESLDAYAKRLAYNDSNIYESFIFETMLNPEHRYKTAMTIQHKRLQIDAKFIEEAWDMTLKIGGRMRHRTRRILQI